MSHYQYTFLPSLFSLSRSHSYDLDHLAQVSQAGFDGPAIVELATLKIYADVALEGPGHTPNWTGASVERDATHQDWAISARRRPER